jgi:hypothetical protein
VPEAEETTQVKKGAPVDMSGSDSDDDSDEDMFMKNLQDSVPLPDGVLKSNLGIPIIVVCHKADLISRGERAQFLEQNIDFI